MRTDLLAGTGPTTLTKRWFVDGTQSDVGTVTFAVTDAAGTAVTSGTATKAGSGATTTYSFSLAIQADPGWLRVVWTRSDTGAALVDHIELVGSVLFTEDELRTKTIAGLQTPLASETDYPDELLAAWRLQVTDWLERRTARPVTRRYCRLEAPGTGTARLPVGAGVARTSTGETVAGMGRAVDIASILSVSVGGVSVPSANVVPFDGGLLRTDATWPIPTSTDPLNVTVEYAYGPEAPLPEATEAGLRLVLANAVPTDISAYATSLSNEDGTFRITAIPRLVEEFVRAHSLHVPVA